MIEIQNITLHRGVKELLRDSSLRIHPGSKSAIIGANGCGKSTLFQLLLGRLGLDGGELSIPASWRISHMAQEVAATDQRALDYVIDGDYALRQLQQELAEAEQAEDHHRSAQLHAAVDEHDGYTAESRAERLLTGLGFKPGDSQRSVQDFSGGWRIRLNLAQALMCPSDLLLLDEPTNHLDLDATLWLEQWLRRYPGTLVLISHDRDFIDNVCDQVVQIEHQQLNSYRGNYSAFERQKAERLAQQQATFEKQQRQIAHIQKFVDRFRYKATKARQAQSRLKELERMERIAPAHIDSPFNFHFAPPSRVSDPVLHLADGLLGYPDAPILRDVKLSLHPGSRLGLLGANGAGKSTLIKSLAGEQAMLSGHRVESANMALGYFSQHQLETLDMQASPALHIQRLSPEAREQEILDFLGGFNFRGDMASEPITDFSGGEKARLALALIVWQKPNLLLLDEPTNHLDLEMCHALTLALQEFEGAVVVVSHDRHLLRNTVDEFLLVDSGQIQPFDGTLEDYSSWLLERTRNPSSETAPEPSEKPVATVDKKTARQQAAALRKQLSPLKKAADQAEQRVHKLEQQLSAIEAQLADTTLYQESRKAELQPLLQQQGDMKQQLELAEEEWMEAQEALDDAEAAQRELDNAG